MVQQVLCDAQLDPVCVPVKSKDGALNKRLPATGWCVIGLNYRVTKDNTTAVTEVFFNLPP